MPLADEEMTPTPDPEPSTGSTATTLVKEREKLDMAYFSPEEEARRADYNIRKLLYEGKHERVFYPVRTPRFRYFVANWLEVIADMWTRLLFAAFPEVRAVQDGDKAQAAAVSDLVTDLELASLCRGSARQASWAGETVWKVVFSREQQRVVVRQVDPVNVTWEADPDDPETPVGASYWFAKKAVINGRKETVYVRERQRLVKDGQGGPLQPQAGGRQGVDERPRHTRLDVTYRAYRDNKRHTEVPLEQAYNMPEDGPPPEDFGLPLDVLTLIYIPNKQVCGDWRGESDYTESLVSIQRAVNDRLSLNQHILDLHSKPTMLVPEDLVHDGMVRLDDIDWMAAKDSGEGRVMYVEWSGEMSASFQQLQWLWEQFCAVAGLSTTVSAVTTAQSGRARELELIAPISEVMARRHGWQEALQRAVYVAQALERKNGLSGLEPQRHAKVVWRPVLPESRQEIAGIAATLLAGQVITPDLARRLVFHDWAEAELLSADEAAKVAIKEQEERAKTMLATQSEEQAKQAIALEEAKQAAAAAREEAGRQAEAALEVQRAQTAKELETLRGERQLQVVEIQQRAAAAKAAAPPAAPPGRPGRPRGR